MSVIIPTPDPAQQVPVFVEIALIQAQIGLIETPDPNRKVLQFKSPNGIAVSIPLDNIGVENLIQALKGTKLAIART